MIWATGFVCLLTLRMLKFEGFALICCIVGGSAKELFNSLNHPKKTYCDTKKSLKEYLYTQFLNNCVLALGAGDIYDIVKNMT